MANEVYTKIFDTIKLNIEQGTYQAGELIPSENMLAEQFKTSRMTVRKALMKLSLDGYIYPMAGKGNFVKEVQFNRYLLHYDEIDNINAKIRTIKLLTVNIIKPDIDLVYYLKIPKTKNVVVIKRLFINQLGQILGYDEKYVPYYSGIPIVENEIESCSFSEIISDRLSPFCMKKNMSLYVRSANADLIEVMQLTEDDSVFVVEQTLFDESQEPIGWGKTYYQMDYFQLIAELRKTN